MESADVQTIFDDADELAMSDDTSDHSIALELLVRRTFNRVVLINLLC